MAVDTRQSRRWLYAQIPAARRFIIYTAGLGWLAGVAFIAQAYFLSRIIHAVFLETQPREILTGSFIAIAAALMVRAALAWLREVSAFAAGESVRSQVRLRLIESITARGPAFTRGERTGALTNVLLEQVEGLHDFYALYLPQMALVVLLPLTLATVVFFRSWAAGGLLLATAPMIPLFTVLVGMGAENISQRHFQAMARMSAHFLDVLQGMATLKIFGRSRDEDQHIAQVSAEFRRRTMSVLRVAFISSAVLEFFASLSIALIAVYLGMSYLGYFSFGSYGRPLSLADGLFILLLAPEFYLPLRELGAHYHARAQALAAADQIRNLMENQPVGISGGRLRPEAGGGIHVQCRDLQLAYDGGRRPALKGVSLDLRPGTHIALVGGSGAGKSSLLFLLLGFIRPDQGEIVINGVPLSEIDPEWWRQQVGWMGPNPTIFQGTVRDNLRLGLPGAGQHEIAASAKAAGVLEFAERLPKGLDTPVGERGVGLSQGQAQRVALGRVLLKNAPLLVLDEPFAGLDADTEQRLLSALESFAAGRSILTVTHRLTDIRSADHILVLDEGRILESGRLEELKNAGGPFQKLAGSRLRRSAGL
jgi:ATP-binding cassette, subfamily C, bacterial CydD